MPGGQRGPVPVPLQDGHTDVTQLLLDTLDRKGAEPIVTSTEFPSIPRAEIKAALDRLASRSMVQYTTKDTEIVLLTSEGQEICDGGSHEWKVWHAVKEKGSIEMKELVAIVGQSAKVGQGTAMKNKWVKKGEGSALVAAENEVEDTTRTHLRHVQDTQTLPDSKMLSEYKKRKLVTPSKAIDYVVEKGPKFQLEIPVEVTDLTAEMLAVGSWETATFKPYNFDALGGQQSPGALHPLLQMRSELRDIFLRDGFVEMPTTRFAESGFWNFDALFVPQQHPARDIQDTFYLSDPATADMPRPDPETEAMMDKMEARTDTRFGTTGSREPRKVSYDEYWKSILRIHEGTKDGKEAPFGSIGYRYPWSADECLKLCLRTHTTATSSWVMHRLASRPRPAKYFSIDRVFRNESVDATHLAEFHQVEGVIADWDFSLPDGMGFLEDFFGQLGLGEIKFKPAYNPYTEPSMEVFGYHKGLGRWVEIGNSGIFRPEMLQAMGLPKNLQIFGFGLSVERPTMIKYGLKNIRDLVGHKVSLDFIEQNGAVRLDK
ncbi:MAG: hypothetical protein Q9162_001849 [Coniocarpon cinnabarinum]